MLMIKKECEVWEYTHLIRVIDCDLKASEDFPCRWMLIHSDLKLALWSIFSIEGRRMVVKIHHSDRHCSNVKVQELVVKPNFRGLDQRNIF